MPDNGGAFIDVDGNLVFQPDSSFVGFDLLQYVVVADGLTSDPAIVAFNVLPPGVNIPTTDPGSGESESETPIETPPPPVSEDGKKAEVESGTADTTNATSTFGDSTADTNESGPTEFAMEVEELDFERDLQRTTYAFANDATALSLELGKAGFRSEGLGQAAVSKFDPIMLGLYWDNLDTAKREFLMKFDFGVPAITASVTSFLTVGYLAWIIRGGVLLTTFMSSLPAWQAFDPLPVIESSRREAEEDDQSIAEMVDN